MLFNSILTDFVKTSNLFHVIIIELKCQKHIYSIILPESKKHNVIENNFESITTKGGLILSPPKEHRKSLTTASPLKHVFNVWHMLKKSVNATTF